jgi:hypothetical protein
MVKSDSNRGKINRYKKLYLQVYGDIESLPALPSKKMTEEHLRLEALRDMYWEKYQIEEAADEPVAV